MVHVTGLGILLVVATYMFYVGRPFATNCLCCFSEVNVGVVLACCNTRWKQNFTYYVRYLRQLWV